MKRHLVSSLSFALTLLSGSFASADDAYDDEGDVARPQDDDFDDEGSDKVRDGGLRSGGLDAPDALGESGDTRTDIEKELDESDEKDSGRGLEFVWLGAEAGFQAVDLGGSDVFPQGTDGGGSGLVYGGALGVRVLYFTLGGRFRYASLGAFNHWSALAEVALRVPLGKLEPYVLVGGGYGSVRGVSGVDNLGGADLRLAGGVHYYLSDSFSAGAQVGGDLLLLSNSAGSATGAALSTTAMLGLHF